MRQAGKQAGSSKEKGGREGGCPVEAVVKKGWAAGREGGRPGETVVKGAPERSFETADPRQALS